MPFVIVAVLVILVISTIYGLIQAHKRLEGLNELAQRLGLNFSAEEDHELADRYGFLKQLAQGENRYATNVLSGNLSAKRSAGVRLSLRNLYPRQKRDARRTITGFPFSF